MNTPNRALAAKIEATRDVLRPSETLPRPVAHPPKHQIRQITGKR